jgi:DNA-binding winged helix-turn-helix (wHTH) protein/TolB-like protein/tetratricopeptide (TPR) repeat protein
MNEVGKDTWLPESVGPAGHAGLTRVRLRDCLVDVDLDRITAPQGETALEPKAMAVLVYLIGHAGAVVSTGELIDAVWLGRPMGDNPVYRCIAQLRRALGDDPKAPRYIATIPTKGYRLIAAVEALALDLAPANPAEPERPCQPLPVDREPLAPPAGAPSSHGRALAGSLLVLVLVLATLAALSWYRAPGVPSRLPPSGPATLAVLPLQAATPDEAGILLAQSMTDLIRNRLARLGDRLVVEGDTTTGAAEAAPDTPAKKPRLQPARFLLHGAVAQAGERLQVDVQLLDGRSGKRLWSSVLDRPVREVASIRDEIARDVAGVLHVPAVAPTAHGSGEGAVDLDAYRVYMVGRRLLQGADRSGVGEAVELFRRATILAPGFARAYLGLGQAFAQMADADPGPADEAREQASKAFDRALELDPALGEAWVERARAMRDPAKAEALFRKGLALAPSYGPGQVHYAWFLFRNARVGEAIDAMERARRIDPLVPELCLTQAFFVMVVRSDVAEHERLVRQALEINPRLPAALYQLAHAKWEYSGEFAQAARIAEQAIAVEPQSLPARMLARDIYLDLGDPAAATAVLGPSPAPAALMEIAQYRGDRPGAAAALQDIAPANWPDRGPQASKAQAIRDAAIAAGDFAPAMRLLQAVQAAHQGHLPMWYRGFAPVYAHTRVLAGDVKGGQALARAALALVDAHGIGRTPHWFSRERAAAFAVLGDDEQALRELAHSVENGQLYRWWYLAERDPLYAHLRGDPRFQALNRLALAQRDRQRALLEAMRRE